MANHLNDILITQFKKIFTLSDFRSSLVQMVFYFGFFVFAIPAAIYMKRFGYKSGVVLDLLHEYPMLRQRLLNRKYFLLPLRASIDFR